MVDKIDMSLDEIIKSNRPTRGSGGGLRRGGISRGAGGVRSRGGSILNRTRSRGGGGGGGGIQKAKFSPRGDVNSAWKHDLYDGPKGRAVTLKSNSAVGGSSKLLVSNLDYGVSDSDIHELFAEFGPLKNAAVHYDRSGRSLGTADVIFDRRADAAKAMKQYNNVPLDGRPMNIQFATSEVPAAVSRGRITRGVPRAVQRIGFNRRMSGGQTRRTPNTGARRPVGGAGARGRIQKGPSKTAEELDAELDAYVNDMK